MALTPEQLDRIAYNMLEQLGASGYASPAQAREAYRMEVLQWARARLVGQFVAVELRDFGAVPAGDVAADSGTANGVNS